MTDFAARTIVLMVAAGGAKANFVALTQAVAGSHSLGTIN